MYAAGAWAMTARLEVRYRRPLPLGQPLEVSAEVVRDRGRWLEAEGRLRVAGGPLVAEGTGLFMRLPAEEARRMEEFYLAGRA
jgi:acyl-coenzyme A thioesterase PaaI-like protein